MSNAIAVRPDWLDLVQEEILEPSRVIIDTHHHLWKEGGSIPYALADLHADTNSGHRVEKTIFLECGAEYDKEQPTHLRSLGEVEFIAEVARQEAQDTNSTSKIAALISNIDLTRGEAAEDVIHQHNEKSLGLFRGVRHAGARAEKAAGLAISGSAPEGLFGMKSFQTGVNILGKLGYCYESWHYHYQIQEFTALARAVPNTQIILNHFGSPLITGIYKDRRDEIIQQWKLDIAELAKCPNVTAKLGGLALSVGGGGWMRRDTPPTSDEFCERQRSYFLHMIDCFGVDRCMFESNFPVDKMVISYPVLWNAFKKIAIDFSEAEKNALFSQTAARVYRV